MGKLGIAPQMMRATFTTGYTGVKDDFDANKIIVKEVPFPIPAADEVQIKVAASSVNPIDWKISCGALAQMMPLDMSVPLGFVCAGVVTAVGSSVTRMKVGQSVWADVIQRGPRGVTLGAYAEYVVTKESKASLKPTNLTFAEAGAIPLAGLTAVQCLRAIDTNEGSSVLVLGGSGATGTAGIQIAKAMGAKVYTTCSTRNIEYVKSLGPDEVIDYTQQDWAVVLKDKGLDGVFDSVGENDGINRAVGVLKIGGKVSTIAGAMPKDPLPNGITAKFIMPQWPPTTSARRTPSTLRRLS